MMRLLILRGIAPIDINAPKNSFESRMVHAYNDCRSEYLHKYLAVLSDSEISYLIQDNYIQKMNVKNVLDIEN